jgi:lysophospholipase L1-like esterase
VSENPQVKAILEHIETREHELADQAEQFRARIEELTRQLGELDAESENLRITRKTLLTLPLPPPATEPDRPDTPDHPAYQQILTALANTGRPIRARDLCQALDLPILPKNTEGIRSKLKRLVSRGILIEPEPGLFARPEA